MLLISWILYRGIGGEMVFGTCIALITLLFSFPLFNPANCQSQNHGDLKLINFDMNGQKIEVKAGDEIQIELEGIGGTGYSWYLDELDRHLLQILDEGTKTKRGEPERIGGNPTIMFWRFRALQVGITTIKIDYYRIWEGKGKAIKHFEIDIQIVAST
jgi:predicted secreted protein